MSSATTGSVETAQAVIPADPVEAVEEEEVFIETPEEVASRPDRLSELEYGRLRANKGWLQERHERELLNFIRSRRLFPKLIQFVKRK